MPLVLAIGPATASLRWLLHKAIFENLGCVRCDGPFNASAIYQRARRHWEPQGIGSISLHDCRHTYASLMIAAGENAKALQTYLGHSSITTTYDRYGHLMPGAYREDAQSTRLGGPVLGV